MRIAIADDSALLREGIAGLLERRGHQVVGTATNATEAIAMVEAFAADSDASGLPDVFVTDVRMPPRMADDGLRAAVELRGRHKGLSIMVLSQYVAPDYAKELMTGDRTVTGGTGYLLKDRISQVADFLGSLEVVASGGMVIDPEVAAALMQSGRSGLAELTVREREVLELMARGLSNTEIAADLVLSGAAVAKHVSNIFAKLRLDPGEENRRVKAILEYLTASMGRI